VFEDQVAGILEGLGYRVVRQVGCSGYRIDMAVVHPARPGQYVLGIECDGATYHGAASARDRDRLREQVLANLGWKLHRVWSTDWFRTRAREIDKMRAVVEQAIAAPEAAECSRAMANVTPAVFEQTIPADTSPRVNAGPSDAAKARRPAPLPGVEAAPAPSAAEHPSAPTSPYVECRLPSQHGDFYEAHSTVKKALIKVVASEGPIHCDCATRRVASAWGISRAGQRVQLVVTTAAQAAAREGSIICRGDFLYPARESQVCVRPNTPGGATRKPEEIAPEEIAAAARLALKDQIKLSQDDLVVATARVLGFERTGKDVRTAMSGGIDILVKNGEAVAEHGSVRLA
jgi:very-short-patch-repair endonuclease